MSWPAASLGGPFDLAESHVDFQSGRISDFVSQAFCGLKFLLSFYTRLGWYVYSVSHLSLKFDLRHTRFILTKQNIMVSSLHLSEYFAGYTFTGIIISHISFFSSFFFFSEIERTLLVVSRNISHLWIYLAKYLTLQNYLSKYHTLQNYLLKYHTCCIVWLKSHTRHEINMEISPPHKSKTRNPTCEYT